MRNTQSISVKMIMRLLREGGIAPHRRGDLGTDVEIAWAREGAIGRITVRTDGTAEGTFPPELFAALCPDP